MRIAARTQSRRRGGDAAGGAEGTRRVSLLSRLLLLHLLQQVADEPEGVTRGPGQKCHPRTNRTVAEPLPLVAEPLPAVAEPLPLLAEPLPLLAKPLPLLAKPLPRVAEPQPLAAPREGLVLARGPAHGGAHPSNRDAH